jgi:type I restriction enzyme R subunit
MKDSGVDWIGDIPAHWDVTKTKWMFEIIKRIKETLSQIIQKLNERLGMEFTGEDKVLEQIVQDLAHDPEMVLRSKNPIDLFRIIYDNAIMDVVLERMTKNQDFCERYLENEEYRREIDRLLLPLVHERLSKM